MSSFVLIACGARWLDFSGGTRGVATKGQWRGSWHRHNNCSMDGSWRGQFRAVDGWMMDGSPCWNWMDELDVDIAGTMGMPTAPVVVN